MTGWAEHARVWILCLGFFVFVPAGLLAKQSMATIFITTALLLLIAVAATKPRALLPPRTLGVLFAIFVTYVATTHILLTDCNSCTTRALWKLPMLALVLWVTSSTVCVIEDNMRRRIALWLLAGLAVGIFIAAIDLGNNALIYRTLSGREHDYDVPLFRYNRGSTALVLLSWPAAGWLWASGRKGVAIVLILFSLTVVAFGDSASALASGLVAVVVAIFAVLAPSGTLLVGFGIAFVFTVTAPWIFLHLLDWARPFTSSIPPSVQDRIEIWHHSAVAVLEKPLTGHGIGAIRERELVPDLAERYIYFVKPPTHPHDAAIQLWLEVGGIGSSIFLALLWVAIRSVREMAYPWRGAMLAAMAGVVFTAFVSYGLWQETWLGIIGMTAIAFRVLAKGTDRLSV